MKGSGVENHPKDDDLTDEDDSQITRVELGFWFRVDYRDWNKKDAKWASFYL